MRNRTYKYILTFAFLGLLSSCITEDLPPPQAASQTGICANAESGSDFDKFMCKGSEVLREVHPTADSSGYCPENAKYGHYFVLIDTTEGYKEEQYVALMNKVLSPQMLEVMGPYDKLSIMKMAGTGDQAIELMPNFSECKPRTGQKGTMFPINEFVPVSTNAKILSGNNEEFVNQIKNSTQEFSEMGNVIGDYSQILEVMQQLAQNSKLEFNNLQGYQYRKLIIFSDMIQNSVDMELVPSCGNRGNCITYDKLRKNYNDEKWMNLKPIFGANPPDVHVYYLACKFDEDFDIGLMNQGGIWPSIFKEWGLKMTYTLENNCEDTFKTEAETS